MATVTILWSLCAVVATMLAGACGFVWLIERRNLASLMFCILGFAAAASGYQELGMMHSATTAEYGEWLRWYHLPIFVTIVGQLLFVHYYLETGRSWLMWVVVAIRSAVLVVNFSVHPNFNFSNIASLDHISLLGEQVSAIGVAVPRIQWQWFASLSLILWLVYLADAAAQRWLQGGRDSRHKALAVILGIGGPLLCSVVYTRLLVYGAWHGPTTNLPWFLGALIMMAYELGRDVILSRRARLESAELRDQLARAERVSMLGQLSSALAHELTQPLNAVLLNVEAAQAHLRRDQPDLDDLRAILADTGRDGLRAAEIVARVRQLLKRGAVELRPVSVETIVQDVIALVHSEATSKQVALQVNMQPDLPHVSGDRVHLSQVLLNLVANSIQAVQSRPRDARIIVVDAGVHEASGEVEIAVRDSGPGLSDSIVDEVFKPFFTTNSEGMGIGLSLSRAIIEAHGGRLWTDKMQDGATFRFTLRRA